MIPARWGMFRQYDAKTAHYLPSSVARKQAETLRLQGPVWKNLHKKGRRYWKAHLHCG